MKVHQIKFYSFLMLLSVSFACSPCSKVISSQCISTHSDQFKMQMNEIQSNDKKLKILQDELQNDLKPIRAKMDLLESYQSKLKIPHWFFHVPPKCGMGKQRLRGNISMAIRFAQANARHELAKIQAKENNRVTQKNGVTKIKETLVGTAPVSSVVGLDYVYSLVCFEDAQVEEPSVQGKQQEFDFNQSSNEEIEETLEKEYDKMTKIKELEPYSQYQENLIVSLDQEMKQLQKKKADRKRSYKEYVKKVSENTGARFKDLKTFVYSNLYPKKTKEQMESDVFTRIMQEEGNTKEPQSQEAILDFFIHPLLLESLVLPLEKIELEKGIDIKSSSMSKKPQHLISTLLNFKELNLFKSTVKGWQSIVEDRIKETKSDMKGSAFLTLITKVYFYNYIASSSKKGPFKSFCKSAQASKSKDKASTKKDSKATEGSHLEQLQQQGQKWSQDPKTQRLGYLITLLQDGFQASVNRCDSYKGELKRLTRWINAVEKNGQKRNVKPKVDSKAKDSKAKDSKAKDSKASK